MGFHGCVMAPTPARVRCQAGCRALAAAVRRTSTAAAGCFLPPLSDNHAALQAGRLSVTGFGAVTVEPDIVEVSSLRCFTPARPVPGSSRSLCVSTVLSSLHHSTSPPPPRPSPHLPA